MLGGGRMAGEVGEVEICRGVDGDEERDGGDSGGEPGSGRVTCDVTKCKATLGAREGGLNGGVFGEINRFDASKVGEYIF